MQEAEKIKTFETGVKQLILNKLNYEPKKKTNNGKQQILRSNKNVKQ